MSSENNKFKNEVKSFCQLYCLCLATRWERPCLGTHQHFTNSCSMYHTISKSTNMGHVWKVSRKKIFILKYVRNNLLSVKFIRKYSLSSFLLWLWSRAVRTGRWHVPVTLELRRKRQEDWKLKTSLGYWETLSPKTKDQRALAVFAWYEQDLEPRPGSGYGEGN